MDLENQELELNEAVSRIVLLIRVTEVRVKADRH